jgi:hypothetical protein
MFSPTSLLSSSFVVADVRASFCSPKVLWRLLEVVLAKGDAC